jgi:hypothetical protein
MVQLCRLIVNMALPTSQPMEFPNASLAPKAQHSSRVRYRTDSPWRTWGRAPGIRLPQITKALKARVSSMCSFPIPDALVTLQTERALNLASRIEHAPHLSPLPASRARQNGAAHRVRAVETSCCCARLPGPSSTSTPRMNFLIERLLDLASPFAKGRG